MFVPDIFRRNVFDDFFEFPFPAARTNGAMKTDVKDNGSSYLLEIDLPGIRKEDVHVELRKGYLTINAQTMQDNDKQEGSYLRRERFSGSYSRSFYVGDGVTEDEIHARFGDGVLRLEVPKKESKPELDHHKYIAIDG